MKWFHTIILIYLSSLSLYGQYCTGFGDGKYEFKFGDIIFEIEKRGHYQLEKIDTFGAIHLHKTEKINDCEYKVYRYKIISNGDLPAPNMADVLTVKIYRVEGNNFYYTSTLEGSEMTMHGILAKKDTDISDYFKNLIRDLEK